MEINLFIETVLPVQPITSQKTGETKNKYSFVGKTSEQYPKAMFMTVFGDEAWKQVNVVPGYQYKVSFDVESREFTGKDGVSRWFTELKAWKAEWLQGQQPAAPQVQPQQPAPGYVPPQQGYAGQPAPVQSQPYPQPPFNPQSSAPAQPAAPAPNLPY